MSESRHVTATVVAVLLVTAVLGPVGTVAGASESEPNDNQENAQQISVGEEVEGSTPAGSNPDYYAVTVDAGQNVTLTAYASAGGANTEIDILDRNGNIVAKTNELAGESDTTGFTSSYSGTYYVRVRPFFDFSGAQYNFTVETSALESFEPNENRGNATELTDERERAGNLTVGDFDWFTFDAEAGDNITLSTAVSGVGETNVGLYDRNGTVINKTTGIDGRSVQFTATANYTGTYYVLFRPQFEDFYGASYNLTVNLPGSPTTGKSGNQTDGGNSDGGGGGTIPLVPILLALVAVLVVAAAAYRRSQS